MKLNSLFLCYSWGSPDKNTGAVCHSVLQWTTFCQNSLLWPIHLGLPWVAWLIALLSYSSSFTMTRLWSMKGLQLTASKLGREYDKAVYCHPACIECWAQRRSLTSKWVNTGFTNTGRVKCVLLQICRRKYKIVCYWKVEFLCKLFTQHVWVFIAFH